MNSSESPKIVSFNEKHYTKLLQENQALQARLRELVKVARANQQIQDHFESLECKILRSRSLEGMARTLVREIQRRFQFDHVTVCLALGPEDILQKVQAGTKTEILKMMLAK